MPLDGGAGRPVEDDVLPGVCPVEFQEVAGGGQLGSAKMRMGIHPGLEMLQQPAEECAGFCGCKEGQAGDALALSIGLQVHTSQEALPLGPFEAQMCLIRSGVPGIRPARHEHAMQHGVSGLVAAEAGGQTLPPSGQAGAKALLNQQVPVRRVVPMKGTEAARRSLEELLLQMIHRALLPSMEGLENLEEPGPAISIPPWVALKREDVWLGLRSHLQPPIL